MERLVINIPETKSNMVKKVLHSLGVSITGVETPKKGNLRQKLLNGPTWTEEELKLIEEARKSFV